MLGALGRDPVRNLRFPLSDTACRSSPPVQRHHHGNQKPTSYWWAGGEGGGEGWLSLAHPLILRLSPPWRPPFRGSGTVGDPSSPQSRGQQEQRL